MILLGVILENRVFFYTFLISLFIHASILLQSSNLCSSPLDKKESKIEVTYLKKIQTPLQQLKYDSHFDRQKQPFLKLPSKIILNSSLLSPDQIMEKENIFKRNKKILSSDSNFTKPAFMKPDDIVNVKKKVTLPPMDMNKVNNPSYISYYQIVREKIRRATYQNYFRTEEGVVCLSFIIANDGSLVEEQIINDKSSPIAYLREIALQSIKEASPFPVFPKDLDYPKLSFNVIISFELE